MKTGSFKNRYNWNDMQLKTSPRSKKVYLAIIAFIVLTTLSSYAIHNRATAKNPFPLAIRNQVTFKIIYPSPAQSAAQIDRTSYDYLAEQKVLTYKLNFSGLELIVSQQPAPISLGTDDQAYYPALGIHPYAQFKTKLGQVALTKFWESSTLKPNGQSGILLTKGTLVTVHTADTLTNEQWKSLFDTLKIAK